MYVLIQWSAKMVTWRGQTRVCRVVSVWYLPASTQGTARRIFFPVLRLLGFLSGGVDAYKDSTFNAFEKLRSGFAGRDLFGFKRNGLQIVV
jgi:hypothetical protein